MFDRNRIFQKIFSVSSFLLLFAAPMTAAEQNGFSPAKSFAQVNTVRKAPVIDGIISEGEYFGCYENFGFLKQNNSFLSSRQGRCWVALDSKYLYFAMQSEIPDADSGVKLKSRYKRRDSKIYLDDSAEFLFLSPIGDAVYHLMISPDDCIYDVKYPIENGGVSTSKSVNWNPELQLKSGFDKKYWTLEVRIPLKDINAENLPPVSKWKMQIARSWRNPTAQTPINKSRFFANPEEMNDVVFVQDSPAVRLHTLGDNYVNGDTSIKFIVDNPTSQTQKIKYSISVVSEAAPIGKDGFATIAPGKSENIEIKFKETSKVNFDLKAVFFNSRNEIIYQRNFFWRNSPEKRWVAPEAVNSNYLEFGIYPYFNKVRVRFGNYKEPFNISKIESASVFLSDDKGQLIGKKYQPERIADIGFYSEFPLDLNKKGNYYVNLTMKQKDGKITAYKEKFEFDKFEWEHNKLGRERIVLPPYKPLKYDNNKIKTLLAEYTLNDGFISALKAGRADALLAAPITLSLNGRKVGGKNFKWLEQSEDLGVCISNISCNNVNFEVRNEFEFDNFIKTTVTVNPGKGFDFKSMALDIPLNGKYAKLIHSTCNVMKYNVADPLPEKDGEIWNSSMGKLHIDVADNFRPYIWIGDLGEGLAFFAESDKNWSRDPGKNMAQIIRRNGVATLRINFIDKPVVKKEPFTLVFGFQATPTRLMPNEARKYSGRVRFDNSITSSVLASGECWASYGFDFFPINHDYTFIAALKNEKNKKADLEWQKKFVKDYMAKNCKTVAKDDLAAFERRMMGGFRYANNSHYIIPYMNVRASHLRWPEYRVFMDEWFCSDFRSGIEDAYNNTPVESYQDYLLYCIKKLLDSGMDGVYYDNIRDWHNTNMVTGPAYTLPSGKNQPYFDIFDMRTLIKRTAVMLYKEGKTLLDGRPLFVHHMTNTNLIPFTSLCGITLDCEAKYGSSDFQERFTEEWLKVSSIALQSGAIPEILCRITGNKRDWTTRTVMAVTMVYDIAAIMAGGFSDIYFNVWEKLRNYGYGTNKVIVYPTYSPSGMVKSNADVRISEYHNADGSMVVCISSFGYAGEVELEFAEKFKSAEDFECSRAEQLVDGNKIVFNLKKHDFKLIKVSK